MKVLLVCYGGGHVKIIEHLYHRMIQSFDVTILALTTAGYYLEQKKIPFTRVKDYKSAIDARSIKYGVELSKDLNQTGVQVIPIEESIAYLGCSFRDLVDSCDSEEEALKLYDNKGRSAFFPKKTLHYIIQSISPDIVITTNSPRGERAALCVAKDCNIPAVCITDNVWISAGGLDVAQSNCADYICVITEKVKNELLHHSNFPAERILVTGSPVLDPLKEMSISRKKKPLEQVKILLADCELPSRHPIKKSVKAVEGLDVKIREELNRLAVKNSWDVYFRSHPNHDINYSKYKNIQESNHHKSILKELEDVNLVITAISTVGLEAKISGASLVSIEGTVYRVAGSYEKLGLSTGIKSAHELENAILFELNRKEVDNIQIYAGSAIDNIEKLIKEILR